MTHPVCNHYPTCRNRKGISVTKAYRGKGRRLVGKPPFSQSPYYALGMGGRIFQREKCESHVLGSFLKISSSFVWGCHLLILGNTCGVMGRGGAGRPTPTRRISHHLLGRPPGCYLASAATGNKALLCCSLVATSSACSCSVLGHDFSNEWKWTASQHLYPIYLYLIPLLLVSKRQSQPITLWRDASSPKDGDLSVYRHLQK